MFRFESKSRLIKSRITTQAAQINYHDKATMMLLGTTQQHKISILPYDNFGIIIQRNRFVDRLRKKCRTVRPPIAVIPIAATLTEIRRCNGCSRLMPWIIIITTIWIPPRRTNRQYTTIWRRQCLGGRLFGRLCRPERRYLRVKIFFMIYSSPLLCHKERL